MHIADAVGFPFDRPRRKPRGEFNAVRLAADLELMLTSFGKRRPVGPFGAHLVCELHLASARNQLYFLAAAGEHRLMRVGMIPILIVWPE